MPAVSGLVTITVLSTKTREVGKKISDTSGLVTSTVLNTNIREVEKKIDVRWFFQENRLKYKISRKNISLSLIITNLQKNTFCKNERKMIS